MNRNGMPAVLGLSLVAGKEEVYEFAVEDFSGGDVDIEYSAFSVSIRSASGKTQEVGAEATGNVVKVVFPALGEGEYEWALVSSDDSGAVDVLISGKLGVFWPNLNTHGEVVRTPNRRVVIRWQDGRAIARWQRTDFASMAVSAAQEAAESAEKALEGVKSEAKVIEGFLAVFDGKVEGVAWVDPDTGNLIIGGVDLGVSVAGKSPYVDNDGRWKYWNDDVGEWVDGGSARGPRGLDGHAVRRIKVASVADIPTSGETCTGAYLYYVPNGEFFDIYAWLEPDGWVRVDMKYDLADSDTYGLMKYGTDEVVEGGAPVGVDSAGRAHVRKAGANTAGVVMTSGETERPMAWVKTSSGRLCLDESSGLFQVKVPVNTEATHDVVRKEGVALSVLEASDEQYGVVRKAENIYDEDGVMAASLLPDVAEKIHSDFAGEFAAKDDVYGKDEVYTKEEADARYLSNSGNENWVSGEGVSKIQQVSFNEFTSMERKDGVLYIVTT